VWFQVTKIFQKKKNSVTYSFRQSFSLYGMQVMLFENQCKWHWVFPVTQSLFLQHVSWQYLHHKAQLHIQHKWEVKPSCAAILFILSKLQNDSYNVFYFSVDPSPFRECLLFCLPFLQITQMESDSHQQYQVQTSRCSSTLMRPTPRTARSSQMTYESQLQRSRKWRNTE